MRGRLREIGEELESVLFKRANPLDSILPPVLFLIIYSLAGYSPAAFAALIMAAVLGIFRLLRGQNLWYALGGAAGVGLAILLTRWLGGEEGFFLPGLFSSFLTVILCVSSLVARKPLVAWSSFIARRWPLDWYWHPQVRPAYSEVTWIWTVYFAVRFVLQLDFFQAGATGGLALIQVVFGWPATVVLLIVSYLYGTWRLRRLGGPSVEEYRAGAEPPWQGQQRGF